MSTLNVGTIKSTGSSPPVFQNSSGTGMGNLVKVWCRYHTSGTTAIDDSYGVSSVTDNGSTYSYVNFSTNFANANYAVSCATQQDSGGGARFIMPYETLVSKVQLETRNFTNGSMDAAHISVLVCGD